MVAGDPKYAPPPRRALAPPPYAGGMATVIYDSDCGFCRWSLALLLSWDRRGGERGRPSPPTSRGGRGRATAPHALRPVALGTVEADRLLADVPVAEREASWHLVDDDGTRTSAGAAFAPVLRELPHGDVPAALVARIPGLTERGYRWVADHRSLLARPLPDRAKRWADRVIAVHTHPRPAPGRPAVRSSFQPGADTRSS